MRFTSAAALLLSALLPSGIAQAQGFTQTNLVSDVPGTALYTDANLVNPWGLVPGATGIFWTSNNATGTSTLYNPDGSVRPLVVSIPGGEPTGIVATSAGDAAFRIPNADTTSRAVFIFVTQHGTVAAWNPAANLTNAFQVALTPDANYTGAALGGTASDPRLYAANFGAGRIDVFNRDFQLVALADSFLDPHLPSGYSPFNIANVGGRLFVAYAFKDTSGDETRGAGLGIVDVFDSEGHFVRRFVSNAQLNAPWAILQAPAGFGQFGGSVLVGNFGDGRIHAFDSGSGAFQGTLKDTLGNPIAIEGLWGLHFGLPVSGLDVGQRLYFAAGIEGETHGLFGYLAAAHVAGPPVACNNDSKNLGFWRKQCGGPSPIGNDDHGNGHGNGHGHGDDHGRGHHPDVSADSLAALVRCIVAAPGPNPFGAGGCFTAGCDLLQRVGRRTDRERAAQQLLTTRLNLCAGAVCDSLLIGCGESADGVRILTVGDVVDSLNAILCNGGTSASLKSLRGLLACANGGEGEDDHEGENEDSSRTAFRPRIGVKPIGTRPVSLSSGAIQFELSTTMPSVVRLRIYDAQGRVVAEPIRDAMVNGTMQVNWSGKDVRGGFVAPGTYFYRATAGTDASSGRIVIIR